MFKIYTWVSAKCKMQVEKEETYRKWSTALKVGEKKKSLLVKISNGVGPNQEHNKVTVFSL